jgi:hypothetical protein
MKNDYPEKANSYSIANNMDVAAATDVRQQVQHVIYALQTAQRINNKTLSVPMTRKVR